MKTREQKARASAAKSLQRDCKKLTLFRLADDPLDGNWRTVMHKFEPAVKAWLIKKYGDRLQVIANESIEKALDTPGAYVTRVITDYECNDLA